MNAVDFKVGNNFLDVGDISIRFDLINSVFLSQSSPGFYSLPTTVQNNEHNRLVLGMPELTETVTSFTRKIPGTIYLFGSPWRSCILSIVETSGNNIELNVVAGVDEGFGDFSTKELRNLDFGIYNDYLIPETYRYSIGVFLFDPTVDSIRISIGQPGVVGQFFTYTVTPTGDGQAMVDNIIGQINTNSGAHQGTAKFLRTITVLSTTGYVLLIKGINQFSENPQTIGGANPSEFLNWSAYIDSKNDASAFATQSNMANHMYGVSLIPDDYELAFGPLNWFFPLIYNPNFFGTPEDAPVTFDYFVNTYNSAQQKFLLRPDTLGQENIRFPDLPACPQPKLSWVLERIFAAHGLAFDKTFFIENPQWDKLLLLNLYFNSIITPTEGFRGPQRIDLRKCMPSGTVKAFLDGLKKLGFYPDFNYSSKTVSLKLIKDLKSKNKIVLDVTKKLIGKITKRAQEAYSTDITVKYAWPSDEAVDERIVDLSNYTIKSAVANTAALPIAGNSIGDVRLVENIDKYYIVDVTVTPNTWAYLCDNFTDFINGTSNTETIEITPVMMVKQPQQKTGGSVSSPVLTTSNVLCPVVLNSGASPYHKVNGEPIAPRLMLYEGMTEYGSNNHPFARTGNIDYNGVASGYENTLQLTGDKGVFNLLLKDNYKITEDGIPVESTFDFDYTDILNLKQEHHFRIEAQEYLWQKISVTIDNKTKSIKPVKALLVRQ